MKRQPLRQQFRLLTVLLILVPSLLIMAIYTVAQIRVAKQQSLEMIGQRVHYQEHLIDYWVAERLVDVQELSQSEVFRTLDRQSMNRTLHLKQQLNKNFDSLSYIDRDGLFKLSTLSTGIQYPSAIGKPYFEAALAGKEYISDIVVGRNSGQAIINFSSPLYDYTGNFQGLLLGSVRTATLEALLRQNFFGQTGEIFLVNREGTMLTELRQVNVLIDKGLVENTAKMNFKITADASRNIQLGGSGTAAWVDYLGNKVLGAYLDVPERGWTVIGKINEAEVLAPIYKQLSLMAGGVILLILLLLPLAKGITNRIKKPIDWLIGQSKQIEAEEYEKVDHYTGAENIPHELTLLCDAFVNMSHKIQNTIRLLKENEAQLAGKIIEIQDINSTLEEEVSERQIAEEALRILNAELETRVMQRTQELQAINAALAEEIAEGQATKEALLNSRDSLLVRETQLKHYASELMEVNKEIKSFANIIAHDFRAPMVNMKGFSEELTYSLADLRKTIHGNMSFLPQKDHKKLEGLLTLDIPDALRFINSSVDKLDRMITALLALSRVGRRDLNYTEVDMNEVVRSVLLTFNHQIEQKGIHIAVGALPKVETDYLSVEQIISNLLDNSIKYLAPGRLGEIQIRGIDGTNEFLFSVQDNGRGIAPVDHEKIFEIFRRAGNQDQPGEGMGLAYVKTLLRQLGGKVWCESELGVGTTIFFTLPKSEFMN